MNLRSKIAAERAFPAAASGWGLVDLANELETGDVLTLDSDFHIYRWGRNRAFRFLIEE